MLEAEGIELVSVEYESEGRSKVLRLLIHKAGGVDAEDCRQVSNVVRPILDVYGPVGGGYTLEVASPGLDRPLLTEADFRRHLGRKIQVELSSSMDKPSTTDGVLKKVDGGRIILGLADGTTIEIGLSDIRKAQIQLMW